MPALGSPQQSYTEALRGNVGGWVCDAPEEWEARLRYLHENRAELIRIGGEARQRVIDEYSIPVIASKYEDVILQTLQQ